MHACANQIIEHFNIRHNHSPTDTIAANPAKLCFVVKQSVRDAAVGNYKNLSIYKVNVLTIKIFYSRCEITFTL